VPARGAGARRRRRRGAGRPAHFRVPDAEAVRTAALSVLRRRRSGAPSQSELARAVRPLLQTDEPLNALGERRLRRLLLETDGVRVDVEYAERAGGGPPPECPVCGGKLAPIQNRTLDGEPTVLGAACPRCGYWTHRRRRVPVRYGFRAVSGPSRVAARRAASSARERSSA
jgi:hypothetical protein